MWFQTAKLRPSRSSGPCSSGRSRPLLSSSRSSFHDPPGVPRPKLFHFPPRERKDTPSQSMKAPSPRWQRARLYTSIVVTSTAMLASPFVGQAKDHVDLQFWDMIWGGPEYFDSGKALVAQFNQQHPDITVTYRSIPWTNWYQTFLTAIGSGTALT